MNETETIFICSCHGEGVMVRHDEEFVFVSLWGYQDNISLWWRIKQAWSALRGQSCTEVVLTPETAVKLSSELLTRP